MLRLAQTRQQNLEENLKRLRSLQEKLYRHQKVNSDLDINSRDLFRLTKEFASMSKEANEMERFETFESIMAPFLRMQMLDREVEENRKEYVLLEQQLREISDKAEEALKELSTCRDNISLTEAQHRELCTKVEECGQHDGACAMLEENVKHLSEVLDRKTDMAEDLFGQVNAIDNYILQQERRLEELGSKRHILESHEAMLNREEVVLNLLYRLEELSHNLKVKTQQLNKNNEEQLRIQEELAQIQARHTDIEQQIQSLHDEVGIHRSNIKDKSSYEVQERVMDLKSRILLLEAAESLWKRISTGYRNIEEKTQLINSLRLEIEQDMKVEQELSLKVKVLRRQTSDKEYTLNMSKSQSLISLRADLVEGTACSVCGATHHPYHSDTMQDQYKLISDFRSEVDSLMGELQGQERQLTLLHDKLTKNMGQQIAEQANLDAVSLRQEEDVREWCVFEKLDPTFAECSNSTDGDARRASIRQLLDNAQRDLRGAEAELSELNYHTTQITNLSSKIGNLENKKSEISGLVNEAISLSRTVSDQGTKLEASRTLAQEKYHRHYELLQNEISLHEWFKLWQESPDNLYRTISKMASDWRSINAEIAQASTNLNNARIRKDLLATVLSNCNADIEELREEIRKQNSKANELGARRQSLLQKHSVGAVLDTSLRKYQQALDEHERSNRHYCEILLLKSEKSGAYKHVQHESDLLSQKAGEQRNMVDVWIRAYNAEHPPVQYSELRDVLTQNVDWNQKRKIIRENQMATFLQQQKVKALQAEIIALEVDTGTLSDAQLAEKQIFTENQILEQEAALREVTLQIAKLQMELGL